MLPYMQLMRLHRPVGIFLLLWPSLIALWISGQGHPNPKMVIIFILGVVVMRSAGCVINDLADQDFDGYVARTRGRPLVTGAIRQRQAIFLFLLLLFVALALVLNLNGLTLQWSFMALSLSVLYPFMKRYVHWPQLILGAAWGMSVPMAFAALTNEVPFVAWLLYTITVIWTLMFDTQYAMTDRLDDQKIGLKSSALWLGSWDRIGIGILQLIMGILLVWLGIQIKAQTIYYIGVLVVMGLFVYQQFLTFKRLNADCFKAFLNNQWVGAVLFLGVFLSFLMR